MSQAKSPKIAEGGKITGQLRSMRPVTSFGISGMEEVARISARGALATSDGGYSFVRHFGFARQWGSVGLAMGQGLLGGQDRCQRHHALGKDLWFRLGRHLL